MNGQRNVLPTILQNRGNIQAEHLEIRGMIHIIRGQQVILDSDLALLYQVETKRLNERVKRNLSRFPESFCFQLTKEENDELFATYPDNPAIKNPGSGLLLTEERLQ